MKGGGSASATLLLVIDSQETEVSNVRITAKVAGYSLVSYTPSLQEYGSALVYNIGGLLLYPFKYFL